MVKTADQIKNIITAFIANIKKKGITVERVIIYGSYANGRPSAHSDIDLAVISSSFDNKDILHRQELLGEAIYPIGEPIEALGYSYREFKKPPRLSFLSEIIATGKTVYTEPG